MQNFGCFNLKQGFKYKFIDNFETAEIVKFLNFKKVNWLKIEKESPLYFVYKDCSVIPLIDLSLVSNHLETNDLISTPILDSVKLIDLSTNILRSLTTLNSGTTLRANIIRVPAHSRIQPFTHKTLLSRVMRKYHIVLETNKLTFFRVGKEHKYMNVGECWEVNNNEKFSLWNLGDTDRTDLIIDILPGKI